MITVYNKLMLHHKVFLYYQGILTFAKRKDHLERAWGQHLNDTKFLMI